VGGGALHTHLSLSLNFADFVHWEKPLHVFGLISEVSVVGAPVSLTMEYHGPSADLLYPECVCESTFLFGTFTDEDTPLAGLPRSSVYGGLM